MSKEHTKREILTKGLKVLQTQGWRSLLQKINKRFLFRKSIKILPLPPYIYSIKTNEAKNRDISEPLRSRISIIIHTRNAGDNLEFLLRKIHQQLGVTKIEIIIIDFYSDDNTLNICKEYPTITLQNTENYYTSDTFNNLKKIITGEYLVITSHDAYPVGNYWLYDQIIPLLKEGLSATTTSTIPHSNADIYNCWRYWYQNKLLGHENDTLINRDLLPALDMLEEKYKTILTNLTDGGVCIKRDLFFKYIDQPDIAGQLDIILRLIKEGHSILLQKSNSIIKSTNKEPLYHLKKSYRDRASLNKNLAIQRNDASIKILLETLSYLYMILKKNLNILGIKKDKSSVIIERLLSDINMESSINDSLSNYSISGDPQLDIFFNSFIPFKHVTFSDKALEFFRSALIDFLEYLLYTDCHINSQEDLVGSLYNLFSYKSGIFLAENSQVEIPSLKKGIFE